MRVLWCRVRRFAAGAVSIAFLVLLVSAAVPAESSKTQDLWFDPTQLPSFTGAVDRFLPSPGGRVDRLVFKEGSQVVFPPDAFDAIRQLAPVGKQLVVWGIRARRAPVITVLAFAAPDGEPTLLDRFYWRPERGPKQGRSEMQLTGKVWMPYLSPQGQAEGAILENGDVVRVEPGVAAMFKDRFAAGAKIAAAGWGSETELGKAIDANRIGETVATLQRLPDPEPAPSGGSNPAGPRGERHER